MEDIVARMKRTMWAETGAGLAAPQIGLSLRLFILDESISPDHQVYMDPHLKPLTSKKTRAQEGCLSFPKVHVWVDRYERVEVTAKDLRGDLFTMVAGGFLARALQHEMDHLNGRLMIDRISPRQQIRALAQMGIRERRF